jgi:hypothetical protein
LRLLATSQTEQYDSIYRFYVSEPVANHVFDKNSNPKGVQQLAHDKSFVSKPYVLEYKYNVDALIQDFETEFKGERDISLVVAWEIGSNTGDVRFFAVILSELVDYLSDVDGVQEYQKKAYSEV